MFVIKDTTWEKPTGRRRTGQAWERGGASTPPHRELRRPQKPAVRGLYGDFLPWAQLIKSLPVGDEVQLQPLAPPLRSVAGAERYDPLIPSKAGFPDNQPVQSHA